MHLQEGTAFLPGNRGAHRHHTVVRQQHGVQAADLINHVDMFMQEGTAMFPDSSITHKPDTGFKQQHSIQPADLTDVLIRSCKRAQHSFQAAACRFDQHCVVLMQEGTAFFPGSSLAGQGLLVTDGATWQRQRQLTNPAFRRAAVEAYAAVSTGKLLPLCIMQLCTP